MLAACNASGSTSGAPASSAASSAAAGPFSWKDARGKEIALDGPPKVVVAQSSAAAALWDAGFQVAGAYGELKVTDGKLNYQAGNLDLSKVAVIGETFGEFNIEKLAALGPQLLIDMSFDDKTLWYVDAKVESQVTALCPTLGVQMLERNLVQVIDSFTELAVKLGEFDGDVIIVDARNTDTSYRNQPTWKALSAVKAGKVYEWKPAAPYSYRSSVGILEGFGTVWSAAG